MVKRGMDNESFEERKRRMIREYRLEHDVEVVPDDVWLEIVAAARLGRMKRWGWSVD